MNIVLSEQDQKIIEEEVQSLLFNFEIYKGKIRCEQILTQSPHLYKVRAYYAFFLQQSDIRKSLDQQVQVFQQNPYFFENTSYMLDNIETNFEKKGRNIMIEVQEKYINYDGEKDGFYYISLALIHRFNKDYEKSYEILASNVHNYLEQKEVLSWFYHQLGCHFQFNTQRQEQENAQNVIKYFSKAIEAQPSNALNFQHIGYQYRLMKSQNKAIEYYTKSLQLLPNYHVTLFTLSIQYQEMQEYQKSFDVIKQCLPNIYFSRALQQYLNLILNYSDVLQVNIDNEILAISEAFQKLLNIEASVSNCYDCFKNLIALIIQHEKQLKYMDMIVNIIELFRINDPFSLFGLNQRLNKFYYKEGIQKMSKIHLEKEIYVSSQIFFTIAYQRILQQQITFQNNYSHWDLYFH